MDKGGNVKSKSRIRFRFAISCLVMIMMFGALTGCGKKKELEDTTTKELSDIGSSQNTTTTKVQEFETAVTTKESVTTEQAATLEEQSTTATQSGTTQESTAAQQTTAAKPSGATQESTTTQSTTTQKPTVTQQSPTKTEPATTGKQPQSSASAELDKAVQSVLSKIVKPGMTDLEKVLVIHDYLTFNVDYDYINYLNNTIPAASYTALGALTNGVAVCDGYTRAFQALAEAAGVPVKYVLGTADGDSSGRYEAHSWNQVKIDGVWYHVDVTWDDFGKVGYTTEEIYVNSYWKCLVSDTTILKDHKISSQDVEKAPKDFDGRKIAQTLAKVSTEFKCIYAEESTLDKQVADMIASGAEHFAILADSNGDDELEHWDKITSAITKTKTNFCVQSAQTSANLDVYKIGRNKDAYCITSLSSIKGILDANGKNKWRDISFWYYDDKSSENEIIAQIESALYDTGYMLEIRSLTDIIDGKVEFYVCEAENVLMVKDLSELGTYLKSNSVSSLMSKKIWYASGNNKDLSELHEYLLDAMIPNGYWVDYNYGKACGNVIKFQITEVRNVTYVKNGKELADMIKAKGEGVAAQSIYISKDGKNIFETAMKFEAESGYTLDYNGGLGEWCNFIVIDSAGISKRRYVVKDVASLKNAIEQAMKNGNVTEAKFEYYDSNMQYNENAIKEQVAATGCPVKVYAFYDYNYYHEMYFEMVP